MVSIDGRWGVAPKLGQSFRMVKCQFTQMSFSVSCAYQKTVWQSLRWKGNARAPGKLISGSRRLTFLHESPPKGTHQPIVNGSPITKSSQKNMDKKKWHLNRLDPLVVKQPATSSNQRVPKEYAGKYASQYMPGSKGDKSEPKEANVVVFAAAEDDNGGSLGRFPWGFMAGLEKGKWYHVISSKHSANSRIFGVTPFSAKMNWQVS